MDPTYRTKQDRLHAIDQQFESGTPTDLNTLHEARALAAELGYGQSVVRYDELIQGITQQVSNPPTTEVVAVASPIDPNTGHADVFEHTLREAAASINDLLELVHLTNDYRSASKRMLTEQKEAVDEVLERLAGLPDKLRTFKSILDWLK